MAGAKPSSKFFQFQFKGYFEEGVNFKSYVVTECTSQTNLIVKILEEPYSYAAEGEIAILEKLRDCPQIIRILGSITGNAIPGQCIAFEYLSVASDWKRLNESLTYEEIRTYSYQLFLALDYCHSRNIIHRDINPTNLHIDRTRGLLKVMSWCFAVEHREGNCYVEFCNNRDYRSPELLIKDKKYDYAIDIWAAGCVIGGAIFPEQFISDEAYDDRQLLKLAGILGQKQLQHFILKYNPPLTKFIKQKLGEMQSDSCLEDLARRVNKASKVVVDLLKKLLVFLPTMRLTARDALIHHYFSSTNKERYVKFNQTGTMDLRKIFANGICERGLETCKFYHVIDKSSGKEYAVKFTNFAATGANLKEAKIVRMLNQWPHINRILTFVSSKIANLHLYVYEYVKATPWDDLYDSLPIEDIRLYIYQLLVAVEGCHVNGIMHRNIKPGNILIDCARKQAYLTDFSQAALYSERKPHRTDVGTIPYSAPELLLKYMRYDHSVDMWSIGCLTASLIFRKRVFFEADDPKNYLLQIISVLGAASFHHFITANGITQIDIGRETYRRCMGRKWTEFISEKNAEFATKEAIDFVSKLLTFDQKRRLTAAEALKHEYFKKFFINV
nr:hypothetical transcript [Hymenolepis microstoma]